MNNSSENNKEKILAKSRRLKQDEGAENARVKGLKISSYIAFLIGFPLFVVFRIVGNTDAATGVFLVHLSFIIGDTMSKYRFTKKKYLLAWLIFNIVVTIVIFVALMLNLINGHISGG